MQNQCVKLIVCQIPRLTYDEISQYLVIVKRDLAHIEIGKRLVVRAVIYDLLCALNEPCRVAYLSRACDVRLTVITDAE